MLWTIAIRWYPFFLAPRSWLSPRTQFFILQFVAEDSVLLNCLARFFPAVFYSVAAANIYIIRRSRTERTRVTLTQIKIRILPQNLAGGTDESGKISCLG